MPIFIQRESFESRIYVSYDESIPKCHIFLKGCPDGDHTDPLGSADYIAICTLFPAFLPMCDCDKGRQCNARLLHMKAVGHDFSF